MSVLINLLPDVRLAKVRAKRNRQVATGVATLVGSISIGTVVILFLVTAGQTLRLRQLQDQINDSQNTLNETTDLPQMLTVQQHLAALPALYRQRVYTTQLFKVMQDMSSKDVNLQKLEIDKANVIKLTGGARNYAAAAKLAKALEASNLTVGENADSTNTPYFTNVSIHGISTSGSDGKLSYVLSATMNPEVTRGRN